MFSRKFFYNRTVNIENPGWVDFIIGFFKLSVAATIVLISFQMIFPVNSLFVSAVIVLFEEQFRITVYNNSVNKFKSLLKFAIYFSIFELITNYYYLYSINSARFNIIYILYRVPTTILHLFLSYLCILFTNNNLININNNYYLYFIIVFIHLFFNEIIFSPFGI